MADKVTETRRKRGERELVTTLDVRAIDVMRIEDAGKFDEFWSALGTVQRMLAMVRNERVTITVAAPVVELDKEQQDGD